MNQTKFDIARTFISGLALLSFTACSTPSASVDNTSEAPQFSIIAGGEDTEMYDGEINKESVRRSIRGRLHLLKLCYENVSSQLDDSDKTKVVARIEIHKGGDARNVRIIENTQTNGAANEKLSECLVEILSATKFPSPPTGKVVQIVYPFHFQLKRSR